MIKNIDKYEIAFKTQLERNGSTANIAFLEKNEANRYWIYSQNIYGPLWNIGYQHGLFYRIVSNETVFQLQVINAEQVISLQKPHPPAKRKNIYDDQNSNLE